MSATLDELRERYLRAQLVGDRREALRVVVGEGIDSGASILDLQVHVIQAAQDELGTLWQQNRVSVAQEHMATVISQLALSALFERAQPKKRLGKKVLIGCVDGELHDLPARLVADLLDIEGFDVRYLGASVPHDDLVASVVSERPDVIGLSVTMTFNVGSLRTAVARLRAMTATPIFIGGHAMRWSPRLAAEIGVEATGRFADELVATARRLAEVS